MSCDCKFSVALHRDATGWSTVCDSGISYHTRIDAFENGLQSMGSYLLTLYIFRIVTCSVSIVQKQKFY